MGRPVDPIEPLEDRLALLGRQTWPLVPNSDLDLGAAGFDTDEHRRSFGRVPERVGQVVVEDLGESIPVGNDLTFPIDLDSEIDATPDGDGPGALDSLARDDGDIDGCEVQRQLVRLGPPKVLQVGDQSVQSGGLASQEMPGPRTGFDDAVLQALQVPVERRQWRPQLMCHVADELQTPTLSCLER